MPSPQQKPDLSLTRWWAMTSRSMTLLYGILTPPILQVLVKQISTAVIPGSNTSSSSSRQAPRIVTNAEAEDLADHMVEAAQDPETDSPNGIRYSKGQDPFYLMHENQFARMLRRAHAGEDPDALLAENWVDTQVMNGDEDMTLGDSESGVILVDLEEEDD